MVSPLNVPRTIVSQGVNDDVCSRSTVVYVSKDVQLVDCESLNDVRDGYDEIVGSACRYYSVDDGRNISTFVYVVGLLME